MSPLGCSCILTAVFFCLGGLPATAEDAGFPTPITPITAPTITPPNPSRMLDHVAIADVDVLALSDEFKTTLDRQINTIRQPSRRVMALHELLFGEDGYDIRYRGQYTRTAMETLTLGGGNCVSLANLYVAAARHAGLDARFQEAHVPEDWEESASGYYVVPGHINVLVRLRGPGILPSNSSVPMKVAPPKRASFPMTKPLPNTSIIWE